MPLFEYRCDSCEHEFEQLVRAGESIECPHCHGHKLEKLLSAPAAHIAGNGVPVMGRGCPPASAPPCSPTCCRLPMS